MTQSSQGFNFTLYISVSWHIGRTGISKLSQTLQEHQKQPLLTPTVIGVCPIQLFTQPCHAYFDLTLHWSAEGSACLPSCCSRLYVTALEDLLSQAYTARQTSLYTRSARLKTTYWLLGDLDLPETLQKANTSDSTDYSEDALSTALSCCCNTLTLISCYTGQARTSLVLSSCCRWHVTKQLLVQSYWVAEQSVHAARLASNVFCAAADLLTGADLDGGEDADSDLSHPDESASGDSLSGASEDAEQEDEDAATDDIATAKGNHKRREDKKLLPTEDKCVSLPCHCISVHVTGLHWEGLSMSGM